ncbi:Oxysterol-binding protein- protein 1C [Ancistrocladus abbreviatus]
MQNRLCCVDSVGDLDEHPPPPPLPRQATLTELLNMPSPSPSFRSQSVPADQFKAFRTQSISPSDHKRHSCRISRSLTSPADAVPSLRPSISSGSGCEVITLKDVVGKGICGILYKWVNYGRGWRARWFALHDGVLSFYKIHGPDKILVSHEAERGAKLIGQESFRRHSRRRSGSAPSPSSCYKPAGEIHLKISTILESRADDKRFSIFTGTKRIRLRAETREARMAWMEALQAAKNMFPRISHDEMVKAQVGDMTVSTEKLRQRLLEEGVSEAAIRDSEQIMRSEFSAMYNQLLVLKQKEMQLLDALRQLETEKFDLENTIVSESQRQVQEQEASSIFVQDKFHDYTTEEGSSDPDDNIISMHEAVEEETEDEDNGFFDTIDVLSSCSFKSSTSEFQRSSFDSDDEETLDIEDGVGSHVKSIEADYPCIKRREKLPDPAEEEQGVSLWSLMKDNIGKDLTKVCLPVYFNEPLSSLQRCFEDMEYSYLIDQAYDWGKMGNSLMQMLNVAAFAVSGYASTEGRTCKPFNPLLGETYEADYPDKGLRFISEKVSHHPMIVACHCEGRGWKFWGDGNLKSKFWGRSIQLDPVGVLMLEFDDGEVFKWNKVTTSIYNLIIGKLYCNHYGTMHIQGSGEYSCKIKFKEQSIIGRHPNQVQGTIQDRSGKVVATLFGKWDESLHYVIGNCSGTRKASNPQSQAHLLWRRSKPSKYQTRYNLTSFAITLNELTPQLEEKLPPTDSRLRPDQRHLENGEYTRANSEKLRLEQKQRQASKMQQMGWKPMWFEKDKASGTYLYVGGYWEAREQGKWESCPNIFDDNPSDPTC